MPATFEFLPDPENALNLSPVYVRALDGRSLSDVRQALNSLRANRDPFPFRRCGNVGPRSVVQFESTGPVRFRFGSSPPSGDRMRDEAEIKRILGTKFEIAGGDA